MGSRLQLLTRWNPERAPSLRIAVSRNERAGRGSRAGGLYAGALSFERGVRRRIDALKIRAVAARADRRRRAPAEADQRFQSTLRRSRQAHRIRRRCRSTASRSAGTEFLKVIYLVLARRREAAMAACASRNTDDRGRGTRIPSHRTRRAPASRRSSTPREIRGIRKASDFLMALQLTGAAKMSSLANRRYACRLASSVAA